MILFANYIRRKWEILHWLLALEFSFSLVNPTKNVPNKSQGGARYPRQGSYRNNSGRNTHKGDWLTFKHADYLPRKCDDHHISERCHFISGQNLLLISGYIIDEYVVSEL